MMFEHGMSFRNKFEIIGIPAESNISVHLLAFTVEKMKPDFCFYKKMTCLCLCPLGPYGLTLTTGIIDTSDGSQVFYHQQYVSSVKIENDNTKYCSYLEPSAPS